MSREGTYWTTCESGLFNLAGGAITLFLGFEVTVSPSGQRTLRTSYLPAVRFADKLS